MRVVRQSRHSLRAFPALCVVKGLLSSLYHAVCLLYPHLSTAQEPVVPKHDVLKMYKNDQSFSIQNHLNISTFNHSFLCCR